MASMFIKEICQHLSIIIVRLGAALLVLRVRVSNIKDMTYLITIAGNNGSGKSSLAQNLAKSLGGVYAEERFYNNPFLPLAVLDPKRWVVQSQLWFFADFISRSLDYHPDELIIEDRSLTESFEIFVQMYHQQKIINDDEFDLLKNFYNHGKTMVRSPDLLIFLDTPPDVCQQRIVSRGRDIDKETPLQHLIDLDQQYRNFTDDLDSNYIVVDGTKNLQEPREVDQVAKRIVDHRSTKNNK